MTDARPSRLRLRGLSLKREQPAYSVSFAGADAVQRLHSLTQLDAERLLSVCAVSLSLYPAWESPTAHREAETAKAHRG